MLITTNHEKWASNQLLGDEGGHINTQISEL